MQKNIKLIVLALVLIVFGFLIFKFGSKESIHHLFNQKWNAESYNKYAFPQYDIAMKALSKWHFQGDEKILDIGCGDGEISYELATKDVPNGSVYAIDISKDMISFAKEKYKVKNLIFKDMDAADINFSDEFNLVTSFYCIHWIQDQQKLLNGIHKSLKENGKVLLYIMTCIDKCELGLVLKEALSMPKWARYFKDMQIPWYFKTQEEFSEIVKASGLKLLSIDTTREEILFKDQHALSYWVKSVPLANHLPEELRDEFFKDMQDIYLKYIPMNQDGSIKFGLPTLIVSAEKN